MEGEAGAQRGRLEIHLRAEQEEGGLGGDVDMRAITFDVVVLEVRLGHQIDRILHSRAAALLDSDLETFDAGVVGIARLHRGYHQPRSVAQIAYYSNGNKNLPKEKLEVFGSGIVATLDDFKTLTVYGNDVLKKSGNQDKGHKQEVSLFLESIRNNSAAPIPFHEIYNSTLATFKVLESIALKGELLKL